MAQRTQSERSIRRGDLAAYLRDLADEFDREAEAIAVEVGNKSVTLRPPDEVDLEVEVVERSSVLRGDRETVDIQVRWKPGPESEPESESESGAQQ